MAFHEFDKGQIPRLDGRAGSGPTLGARYLGGQVRRGTADGFIGEVDYPLVRTNRAGPT